MMLHHYRPGPLLTPLAAGFWNIGHKLFRTDPATFPVTFLAGDVLDSTFTGSSPISYGPAPPAQCPTDLRTLHTLAPLTGRLHAVHASNFFHLFSEANQATVARALGALLAPVRGAMLFGTHVSRPARGLRTEAPPPAPGYLGNRMFCHSAQSWTALWDGGVFARGTVRVEAQVVEQVREDLVVLEPGVTFYELVWCVTRL